MSEPNQILCENCRRPHAWTPDLIGLQVQCECGAMVDMPFEPPSDQADDVPVLAEEAQPNESPPALELPPAEEAPVEFGASVPCAYQPSGEVGNLPVLTLYSVVGMIVGLAAGLACGTVAALINYGHSYLPVYIFIIPIFIVLLIAVTPGVVSTVTGAVIGHGVVAAKCRNAGIASLFSTIAGSIGIVLLILIADLAATNGLVHFIRLMIGGCFHVQWGGNFQPVNLPAWVIYGVFVLSGIVGVLIGNQFVTERVASTPYCEECDRYLDRHTLWSIVPSHMEPLLQALDRRDLDAAQDIPACPSFDNRVDVVLWVCNCKGDQYLELFGHTLIRTKDGEQRREPVRVFSIPLSIPEAEKLLHAGHAKSRSVNIESPANQRSSQ